MGLATWTVLASVPIGVASKTEEKIVTFTQPVRTADLRFFAFPGGCEKPCTQPNRHLRLSFIVQPWNQIWVDSAASTSNNYVGGASWAVLTGPAEMIAVSAQTTLPSNVSAGASNYFGTRFKFRGNTASRATPVGQVPRVGGDKSVRLHHLPLSMIGAQDGVRNFQTRERSPAGGYGLMPPKRRPTRRRRPTRTSPPTPAM